MGCQISTMPSTCRTILCSGKRSFFSSNYLPTNTFFLYFNFCSGSENRQIISVFSRQLHSVVRVAYVMLGRIHPLGRGGKGCRNKPVPGGWFEQLS